MCSFNTTITGRTEQGREPWLQISLGPGQFSNVKSHPLHTAGAVRGVAGRGLQRRGRLGPGAGAEAAGGTECSRDTEGHGEGHVVGSGRRKAQEGRGRGILVLVQEVHPGPRAELRTPD